jgi:hypothetical protein
MRSLTYLLKNRVRSPEKFWSAAEKDFCNKIGPSAKFLAHAKKSLVTAVMRTRYAYVVFFA